MGNMNGETKKKSYLFLARGFLCCVPVVMPWTSLASFTKEVNPRLAKRPLKTSGRFANLELNCVVKDATGAPMTTLSEVSTHCCLCYRTDAGK